MSAQQSQLENAVWVQIGTKSAQRWPLWKRRWLVLDCGGVFVPVDTDKGSEGIRAIRDGAAYAIQNGRLYVAAEWLVANRERLAARALSRAVRGIRRAGRCF